MVKKYFLSVRLSDHEVRAYIRLLCKVLGNEAYPHVNVSKSDQFRMLLDKLDKVAVEPPFCNGQPLSEYYLEKWKVTY